MVRAVRSLVVPGLAAIASRYDAILLDQFGVLHNGREALPGVDFADELATWEGLLYKPEWSPLPLAGNLCVDPAISTCLDQCGGI